MSVPKTSTDTDAPVERSTRLRGAWLILGRCCCVIVFASSLTVWIADLPEYFAQLHLVCRSSPCTVWELTPHSVAELGRIGLTVQSYAILSLVLNLISVCIWFSIAALIALRKSSDWLALLVAMQLVTTSVAGQSNFDLRHLTNFLVPRSSLWFGPTMAIYFLAVLLFGVMFLLFPDGHFVPQWMFWFVILTVAFTGTAAVLFLSGAFQSQWLPVLFAVAVAAVALLGTLAQVYRYRSVSTPLQRQQSKWIVLGIVVGFAGGFGPYLPSLFFPSLNLPSLFYVIAKPIGTLLLLFGPVSWAVAIFRYRLWDIDTFINRTIVYGTLTGILALIYVGSIILLQYLLRGIVHQNNDVAIVISTLLIAALFQPLRHRVQLLIDRRFYRRKYDAAKALEAFSASLRSDVHLDQLREHLIAAIEETVQPAHVMVWLRRPTKPEERPEEQLLG